MKGHKLCKRWAQERNHEHETILRNHVLARGLVSKRPTCMLSLMQTKFRINLMNRRFFLNLSVAAGAAVVANPPLLVDMVVWRNSKV
mgnify:CR=1 FL=1